MANIYTQKIIHIIENKFGKLKIIGDGYSLYYVPFIDITF